MFWPDLASSHYGGRVQEYLKSNKICYVPKWCNPANCPKLRPIEDLWGNIKQKVSISKVYFQYTGYEDFYCVMLEAIDENGNKISEELDLAYVHFRIGSKAYNVGHTLGLACDPCTIPFTW